METQIIVGHQERSIVLILQSYHLPPGLLCQKNYGCVRISNQGIPWYSSECMLLHESSLLQCQILLLAPRAFNSSMKSDAVSTLIIRSDVPITVYTGVVATLDASHLDGLPATGMAAVNRRG